MSLRAGVNRFVYVHISLGFLHFKAQQVPGQGFVRIKFLEN